DPFGRFGVDRFLLLAWHEWASSKDDRCGGPSIQHPPGVEVRLEVGRTPRYRMVRMAGDGRRRPLVRWAGRGANPTEHLPRPRLPWCPVRSSTWMAVAIVALMLGVVLVVPMVISGRSPHGLIRREHIEVGLSQLKGLDPQVDEVQRTLDVFMGYATFREVLGGH